MWYLPGPGTEPLSPALEGGFLTPGPPGKSHRTVFKFSFPQPCNLHMCLKGGLKEAGWPPHPAPPTLYYSDIFSGVGLPEEVLSGRCQKKRKCDQRKSISQLPVVEGSLPWTSSGPGASEGSSHSTQASSPAGQRPPPPVPPVLSASIQQCK